MNWDAITALAESVGTVGVIASLLYVAMQIRQNTRGVRMATFESALRGVQEHTRALIGDPELLRVHFAGLASFDDLGPEDRLRFHGLMLNWVLEYQLFKRALDEGAQSRVAFAGKPLGELERNVISMLRTPGGQTWWRGQTYVNPVFRAEVDRVMAEHPDVRFGEGDPYFGGQGDADLVSRELADQVHQDNVCFRSVPPGHDRDWF